MRWSDEYATGIERIDNQHRTIFKMAEHFREALDEGQGESVYGILLESLDRYVRNHVGFEERCMDDYDCPVAEQAREAHQSFVDVLSGYRQRFQARGFDRAEARKLVDTIDQWLADHICRIDLHLKQCVQKP